VNQGAAYVIWAQSETNRAVMMAPFDLIVIGDDAAGLCTAACMARTGARVGLLKTPKRLKLKKAAIDGIPNFVWRRLDLQKYNVAFAPVSAVISLSANGQTAKTVDSVSGAVAALEESDIRDHEVWADFVREVRALSISAGKFTTRLAIGRRSGNADGRAEGGAGAITIRDLGVLTNSCADFLDDYFDDDRLKTHIGARALAPMGLGGAEPGSVLSLSGLFEQSAWPVRAAKGGAALEKTLAKVCVDAGVEMIDAVLSAIDGAGEKYRALTLSGNEKLKSRFVFCPTPDAARRAGLVVLHGASPIAAPGAAKATIRIKLSEMAAAPSGDDKAVFFVAGNMDELQAARDAVVEGRLPEKLPLEFQFAPPREIIVQTAYAPDRFIEDGEAREWTGQDRQALGARVIERLSQHIDGLGAKIVRSEVSIEGAYITDDEAMIETFDQNVIVQPAATNVIAAAVTLADRLLNGG